MTRTKGSIRIWSLLRDSTINLAMAFMLVAAGGAYWTNHQGADRVARARQSCEEERDAARAQLLAAREALAASRAETEALREEQQSRRRQADALAEHIQAQQQALIALWEEQRPLIERMSDLQAGIDQLSRVVRQRREHLSDLDRRIAGKRDEVALISLRLEEHQQASAHSGAPQAAMALAGDAGLSPAHMAEDSRQ